MDNDHQTSPQIQSAMPKEKPTVRTSEYHVDLIKKIEASFQSAPVAERSLLGKKEAILALKPAIKSMRDKGYTVEQIADRLTAEGLNINAAGLRGYLSNPVRKKPKSK